MHPRLFFPLPSELIEQKKNPNYMETMIMNPIKKARYVKNNATKKRSKLGINFKKFQPLHFLSKRFTKAIWILAFTFSSNICFAATTPGDNYAFTQALFNIMSELKGAPIAIITAIGIIGAGFLWVFKGHDVGLKQVIGAMVGGGIVIAAPTLVTMIPGMSGALI